MDEQLGKASLRLEVDTSEFRRNMQSAHGQTDDMKGALDSLAAIAKLSQEALGRVKMSTGQAAESKASAEGILSGVRGISDEARDAARILDSVRISEAQATASTAAGERIKRNVNDIGDEADRTKRKLEEVKLAGGVPGRSGVGVGPLGSGYGRIGLLGAGIGAGILTGPAAVPAALGLLAATPVLAGAAGGALGTLALAFDGVGKAIGGDKKAFDGLGPSAQALVQTVRSLDGWFDRLRETAAGNLFPGLERGLKAALSPSTLNAITGAVTALGRALGSAGEAWGKYFGSPEFARIFGPLMQSAAGTLSDLSDAALHLFDALGVLARAAIPLTSWMTAGIDSAAKLADGWLRAKDATGQLGRAMGEAQTSLRLVGGLVGSLLNAVGALGQALYPVAKVAMKDLTDAFNGLAGLIRRNQDVIRTFVGTALTGLKTAVELVVGGVKLLNDGLQHVVGSRASVVTAILAIGAALALTLGPGAAAVVGAVLAIGVIEKHWSTVVGFFKTLLREIVDAFDYAWVELQRDAIKAALAMVEPFSHLPAFLGGWARDAKKAMQSELDKLKPPNMDWSNAAALAGADSGNAWSRSFQMATQAALAQAATIAASGGSAPAGGVGSATSGSPNRQGGAASRSTSTGSYSKSQLAALWVQAGGNPAVADTMAAIALAESGGRTGATNYNTNGTTDRGLWQINSVHGYAAQSSFDAMQNAREAVSVYNSQGLGAWTTYNTGAYLRYSSPGSTTSPFGTAPAFTSNLGSPAPKPTIPSGANLLPQALRNALQKARDKVTTSQGAVAARWLNTELADLEQARKLLASDLAGASGKRKANIQAELRTIDGQIATVNKDITSNLREQASAIKSAFTQRIATAKGNISSAVGALTSALDSQLAAKFFQNGAQTPLEAQLAQMQAQDTANSLQDALAQAQASGDPAQIAAAQRAITENNLAIAAAAERARVDKEYAEAQASLNAKIGKWADGIQNGTTKMSDLTGIVDSFGLSLSADGGIIDDFSTLQDAVKALALVLAQEAGKLAGVGDTKDSKKIQDIIDRITGGLPSPGRGGLRMVPMAAGGVGRVSMPTLFLAGEAGPEDYAFSGAGRSLGKLNGGGLTLASGAVQVNGNLIHERDLETVIVRALQSYVERGGRPIRGLATT